VTGSYTILINPGELTVGSVTSTLYNVPPDVTGTITISGPAVTVTTTTPGQNARLSFSGTAGQRVFLGLNATLTNSGISYAGVSILKPDGTGLGYTTIGNGNGYINTQTLPDTGSYTVLVDPGDFTIGSVTSTLYN